MVIGLNSKLQVCAIATQGFEKWLRLKWKAFAVLVPNNTFVTVKSLLPEMPLLLAARMPNDLT